MHRAGYIHHVFAQHDSSLVRLYSGGVVMGETLFIACIAYVLVGVLLAIDGLPFLLSLKRSWQVNALVLILIVFFWPALLLPEKPFR